MEYISKLAETISYIISSIGILAGGIWVYWQFVFQRLGKWNLGLKISTEILHYNSDSELLLIIVKLKNEGNRKISPGDRGCRLTVRKMEKDANKGALLDLDSGEPIINDHDLLKKYYREKIGYKRYEIEPKAEYSEVEMAVVSKDDLLSIRVEFFGKGADDSITEYAVCKID